MKKLLALISVTLTACSTMSSNQTASTTSTQPISATSLAPVANELSDLSSMTFACPKAALNAAAREAKKVHSQGSYQFTFFRIANKSHHAQYEVHFKSNVFDEPELKYCVSIYCQQGWNPKTSKTLVRLMSDEKPPSGDSKTSDIETMCGGSNATSSTGKNNSEG